ncbi:MAG: hypothetical protein ACTSO3_14545, partial [Candidatus Heimdallarchaeaceae archaeon]
ISLIISYCFLLIWMPLTPLVGKIPLIPLIVQGYIFGFFAVFAMSAAFLFPYVIIAETPTRSSSMISSGSQD